MAYVVTFSNSFIGENNSMKKYNKSSELAIHKA